MSSQSPSRREILISALLFFIIAWAMVPWPLARVRELCTTPFVDPAGVLQVHSWKAWSAGELSQGRLPLWNPHTGLGQPHLANIQTAIFFPLHVLLAFHDSALFESILLVLRLWLSAVFIYYFARRWGFGIAGAFCAGSAYSFGGYGLWFIQLIDLNSQMLLPLLMHEMGLLARRQSLRPLFGSALVGAFVILGGHPEAIFVTFLVAVIFALFAMSADPERKPRRLITGVALLGAAGVCSAILTMIVLLPFINYLPRCWSMHGAGFGFFHLELRGLLALIYPGVHHVFANAPDRIPVELLEQGLWGMFRAGHDQTAVPGVPPGCGAVVGLLALYAIMQLPRMHRMAALLAGMLMILLGLTFGLPGFRFLIFIPPFSMFSNFKFYFSEISFCLAMLAGLGADRLCCGPGVGKRFFIYSILFVLIAVGVECYFLKDLNRLDNTLPLMSLGDKILPLMDWPLTVAMIIVLYVIRKKPNRKSAASLIPVLLLISLFFHSRQIGPYIDLKNQDLDRAAWLKELVRLNKEEGPFRMTGLENFFPPNLALPMGLDDVRSSDALFYKPYIEVINEINGFGDKEAIDYFYPSYFTRPSPDRLESAPARPWNIRYAVGDSFYQPGNLLDTILYKNIKVLGPYPLRRELDELYDEIDRNTRNQAWIISVPFLFQHPPSRIDLDPAASIKDVHAIRFNPVLITYASDGVQYSITGRDVKGPGLLFSRFYSCEQDLEIISESPPGRYLVELPRLNGLSFITLPGPHDNRDDDWSGWTVYRGGDISRGNIFRGFNFVTIYSIPADPRFFFTAAQSVDRVMNAEDKIAVKPLRINSEKVELAIDAGQEGFLAIAAMNYPGWRAFEGENELKIESVKNRGQAVRLPAGRHSVTFIFKPCDFRIGLYVSMVCLLMIIAPLFFIRRRLPGVK